MPRVYSPAGEQLAWLGEAIGDDVETYEIERKQLHATGPMRDVLRYTRDGITWEVVARKVDDGEDPVRDEQRVASR